ncbi:MAG: hypothetical protein ACOYL6_16640 [Bacteriovoracaceae bacterium]
MRKLFFAILLAGNSAFAADCLEAINKLTNTFDKTAAVIETASSFYSAAKASGDQELIELAESAYIKANKHRHFALLPVDKEVSMNCADRNL